MPLRAMSEFNGSVTGGSRNAQNAFLDPGIHGGDSNFRQGQIQRLMIEAGCSALSGIGGM